MPKYNQLSRYGAISKILSELAPSAKAFLVGDADNSWYADFSHVFPVDEDGVVRVYSDVDSAINACTASRGDRIYVMPGHAETISAAGGWTLDVAGVSIIGLGSGANRPVITFDGSDATPSIVVSAANCAVKGFRFVCNEASQSHMFDVKGDDFTLEDNFFTEGTATGLSFITADTQDGDSDRLTIKNCRFYCPTNGNYDNAIQLAKDHVGVRIEDCDIYGSFDDAGIHIPAGGNACLDIAIRRCRVVNLVTNTAAISINGTSCTGELVDTRLGTDTKASALDNGSLRTHNVTWADTTDQVAAAPIFPEPDSATNILGVNDSDNGFDSSSVSANADGSVLERQEYIQTDMLALPRCVEKSDGAVLSGTDDLFTITGGPVLIKRIVGLVTTTIGAGTTNVKLQITTTTPAATVDMNAGAVDIDADAAGTSYRSINTTAVFTPVTAGFVMQGNAFATSDTEFLAPIGTIKLNSDAARAGVIKWYLEYVPLSQNSRVAAAA